jgi:hypothetical protein
MAGDQAQITWRKSSWSVQGNCVEVAELGRGLVGVRDTKDKRPILVFGSRTWRQFISSVKGQSIG